MKRRLYLLFMLVLTLFTLVGCGGNVDAQQSNQGNSEPARTQAPTPSGDPMAGKEIFSASCAACHGPDGEGVPGLGKDMTASDFIAGKSDEELVEFIKVGRDPSDPLNTTGVAMPPKGGNPALSDEDVRNVVSFVRSLQK